MKDTPDNAYIDFVFDGPPDLNGGRLVEIEDATGASVSIRTWLQREDGCWVLRVTPEQVANPERLTGHEG
jgi:hypothetical protein